MTAVEHDRDVCRCGHPHVSGRVGSCSDFLCRCRGWTAPRIPDEVPQTWYFTFGQAHENARRYYVVRDATWEQARVRMVEVFGLKWAFQYDEGQWTRDGVTQAERYGLEEVK